MARVALVLVGLFLAPLATTVHADGEKPGKPSPPTHVVDVPAGIPVQLDGHVIPAEWEDASQHAFRDDGSVLKLKQVRGTLLLAIDSPARWLPGSRLWLAFAADDDAAGLYSEGSVRLDFEPLQHDRPHLLVMRHTGPVEVRVEDAAVARALVRGGRTSVEVAVPLTTLGLTKEEAKPIRFLLLWAQPGARKHPTWPEGMSTTAAPGQAPPDLASSRRWARLQGWKDVDGPGAFPAADWKTFLDEDRELTRRGREAHAFGMLIEEERLTQKRDATQAPALVDNLRWIAEREPLAPSDLMLLARGYRFLNRTDEALAVLDALDAIPSWSGSDRVTYARALTLRSAERYEEAARAWERLARSARKNVRAQYEATAASERERLAEWEAEQAARREDESRGDLPLVLVETDRGPFLLLLHADDVPRAVEHFLALVDTQVEGDDGERRGFYDGLLFHRVIGDFMAQGGDELTRGGDCAAGGPGDGPRRIEVETNHRHGFWRGALAFARGPALVNGSQFFVLVSPRPDLGRQSFTCFGHVVAGMDVVDRLEQCDAIRRIRVLRRGSESAAEAPDAPQEAEAPNSVDAPSPEDEDRDEPGNEDGTGEDRNDE